MSWNGQAITTMRQILRVHDGTIQRVSELGRGQQGPVSTFFSPNAEYLLAIEEQSGGRLLTLYKMQDDTVESLDEPQFLEGYIMDINVVFHATAPLFAVSSTSMDSYSGVVTAETRVVEISDGNWTWHHISSKYSAPSVRQQIDRMRALHRIVPYKLWVFLLWKLSVW